MHRAWVVEAVNTIERDFQRSADTHLIRLDLPAAPGIDLYIKDESTHPTGSLKHRLARSLFLYAICNGWVTEGTTIIEASSGSTAVSEAYFSRLLGLPFVAVMPRGTSAAKVAQIAFYGGRSHFVDNPAEIYSAAEALARETNGHYMDQFTYAERATDWRSNNNIAESIFSQMEREPHPIPRWVITGAVPAVPRRRSGVSSATSDSPPASASSTRRTRSSSTTSSTATRASPATRAAASKASAGRASSRRSSPTSSTG